MAITAETRNSIIELVVTAYNAAPGTTLLTELVAIIDGGGTLADVAANLTTSDRWTGLYPSFQTSEEFAAEWLGQLVPEASADALAEGVAIAVGLINGGASFADLMIEAQGFLSNLDEADTDFGTSAANFNNKVEVSTQHTVTLEKDGTADELANVLAAVDSTQASVDAANETEGSTSTGGTTFTLTKELDTFSGTVNDDTVTGVLSTATTENTWNIADSIDGGAGDNDALNVTLINDAGAGDAFAGQTTTGIEVINIRVVDVEDGATTSSLAVSGLVGVNAIWVNDSTVIGSTDDTFSVSAIGTSVSVGLRNNDSDLDVNFTNTGTATSGDSITLLAGGGSTGDVDLNDAAGDGFVTVNVVTMGTSKTTLSSLDAGSDFLTLNISGDQAFKSTTVNTSVTTIDASGNTGAVEVNAAAGTKLTATGTAATTDKLHLSVASSVTTGMAVTGFETISFKGTATATVDMDLFTDVTKLEFSGSGTAGTLTLKDLDAAPALVFNGFFITSVGPTHGALTVQLKDITGASDSVSLTFGNFGQTDGKVDAVMGAFTAAGIETISIASADYDNLTIGGITATSATVINNTGSADVTFGTISAVKLETFDASSATGDLTLGTLNNSTQDSVITTGSGKDSVTNATVANTFTQIIATGDGIDTVTVVDAAAGGTVDLNTGGGDDKIIITTATPNGTLKVDGGADTDLLTVTNAVTINLAFFDNVEAINFTSGATVLNLTVPSGYTDTVLVTDVSAATITLNFNPASGGTVNVSKLDMLGWTSGTDILSVTSGAGAETITLGSEAGIENVIFAAGSAFGDTVSGFTVGAGGDSIDLTITVVEALNGGGNDLVESGGAASAAAGAITVTNVPVGAFNLDTATSELLAVAGTYAAANDLETALETGGASVLTLDGALAANDQFLVAYSDGTNTIVAVVETTAGAADNASFAAADLTVTVLVTLSGVTDVTTLHTDNFNLI